MTGEVDISGHVCKVREAACGVKRCLASFCAITRVSGMREVKSTWQASWASSTWTANEPWRLQGHSAVRQRPCWILTHVFISWMLRRRSRTWWVSHTMVLPSLLPIPTPPLANPNCPKQEEAAYIPRWRGEARWWLQVMNASPRGAKK